MVPARTLGLPAKELVLGAQRGGEARMYPTSMLLNYHIVNDTLGSDPFLVAFCPKCFSGVALDPVVDGQTLTFRVFGAYQGTWVMTDDQTGTIWAFMTGEALVGPLVGATLRQEPLRMTTFKGWMELHPESTTPDPAGLRPPVSIRPGDFALGHFELTVATSDDRLAPQTLVFGVHVGDASRAYMVDLKRPGPRLLQDILGGVPIVLIGAQGAWPLAFDRRLGTVLEFSVEGSRVVDETGSEWDAEGRAVKGPMAGAGLEFIPSHISEWYAWAAYHPQTSIATATVDSWRTSQTVAPSTQPAGP